MSENNNNNAGKNRLKSTIRVIIVAAVIAAGVWIWNDFLEDRIVPKRFGVVEDGSIFRSGQISPSLIEGVLKKHDIKVIVNLTLEKIDDKEQDAENIACEKLGIEVLRFPMNGYGIGSVENYAGAVAAIDRSVKDGKPVLVHCNAGAQRTGGVIASYRLLVQKKDTDFILKEMRRYGWRDRKNPKLLDFLNENLPQVAQQLYRMQVISEPSLSDPVFPD